MGEGEAETGWRNNVETYTSLLAKWINSGDLLHDAGSSNLVLCYTLEGWDGVGGGREFQEGKDICISMVDLC